MGGDGSEGDEEKIVDAFMAQMESEFLQQQAAERTGEKEKQEFRQFQDDQLLGRRGRAWSIASLRMALAVWARSPAAFRTLRNFEHLRLPAEKSLSEHVAFVRQTDGVKEDLVELFIRQLNKLLAETPGLNITDVALYWDEVKLQSKLGFATLGSRFLGATSSAVELAALGDLFHEYTRDAAQPVAASYACVFAVRLMERPAVSSPVVYVLTDAPMNGGTVAASVLEVIDLVQAKELLVRLCCADGASTNIAA